MMGFQGPPVMNEKIPPEAYALIMQPQFLQTLKMVNGMDLLSMFYFQMPFMLLPKDSKQLEKGVEKLGMYTGLGLAAGTIFNVQVKRISLQFLKWPIIFRVPIRLSLMALPFALLYPKINQYVLQMNKVLTKLELKKDRLIKNKDLQQYFEVEKPQPKGNQKKKK